MEDVGTALVALLVAATVPAILVASAWSWVKEFIGGPGSTDD